MSLNNLHGVIGAKVNVGAEVNATGNILITATDDSDIEALAGQGGGATVGIGAAAAYNEIANTVAATATSAALTSTAGSIFLTANEDSAINNIRGGRSNLVLAGGVDALSRAPLLFSDAMVGWLSQWYAAKTAGQRAALLAKFRPDTPIM